MATCDHPSELIYARRLPESFKGLGCELACHGFQHCGRKMTNMLPVRISQPAKDRSRMKCFTVTSHQAEFTTPKSVGRNWRRGLPGLVLCDASCCSAVSHAPLPKRETVTMLYYSHRQPRLAMA